MQIDVLIFFQEATTAADTLDKTISGGLGNPTIFTEISPEHLQDWGASSSSVVNQNVFKTTAFATAQADDIPSHDYSAGPHIDVDTYMKSKAIISRF